MYGLPKIHKQSCPLRPILSMTGSAEYRISKWLCMMIQPVLDFYCKHNVKDTFQFVEILHENPVPSSAHMCSFDVVSLFTNVPLSETINICAETLYHNKEIKDVPWLSEAAFRRLMLMVTSGVEFSFDDIMYKQTDGVAMGSPLGPVLANVFVGYCESKIDKWPELYVRFVDDSFTYFDSRADADDFLLKLNTIHPALRFTCEHEESNKLLFLDVLVEKTQTGVLTTVYRKPTFTGQYMMFDSFCSSQYKSNLVRNLVNRAQRICSPTKLQQELDFLRSVFVKNGYPQQLLDKLLTTTPVVKERAIGPLPCRVFLCLPWKGKESRDTARVVKSLVEKTYFATNVVTVFTTIRSFTMLKDVLPTLQLSHLIYYFECRQCGSRYVGRTLQHLSERIKQHVPLSILSQAARSSRPKRGRRRKHPTPLSVPAEASAPQTVSRKNQHSTQKLGTNINVNKDEHCVLSSLSASTGTPDADNRNSPKLRRSKRLAAARTLCTLGTCTSLVTIRVHVKDTEALRK
ncbi:uncharacterized protein LOC135824335 [Sycon ciliatum]|uniref:uncharacterized protein LOC135824335 n=1 Tax=Sycon ciliatum TaxID=27933 RepID=UPI0031F6E6C6